MFFPLRDSSKNGCKNNEESFMQMLYADSYAITTQYYRYIVLESKLLKVLCVQRKKCEYRI